MTQLLPTGTTLSAISSLDDALLLLDRRLVYWSSNADAYNSLLLQVFGVQPSAESDVLLASINGSGLGINLQILDATAIDGLMATYASSAPDGGERIYLNAAWLSTATAEQIEAVLLEEIGHAIDYRLNGSTDSAGDEGAIFSALLRGETPDSTAYRENDQRILSIDGVAVAIEASTDTTRPTGSQASFVQEEGNTPFGIADVGYLASPAFADIDGDGDLDLFIGNVTGKTLFFRNTAAPGATTPAYTQEEGANGEPNPFGIANVGLNASPAFADIDGDGDLDLFIGNNDGKTLFFRNTATPGATTPAYTQEEGNTPFGIAGVGSLASPAFADIDGDGDLDLFIGDYDGNTLFFRNTAAPGATTPAYTQEEGANGEPNPFEIPAVGGYASPAFADIDADGDLDLFIGNRVGNTLFFRNTATPGATTPAYTQEEGNTPFGIPDDVGHASPAFADIDGDGDLDLFIGDYDGNTLFFRNTAAPPVAPVNATTANGSYGIGAVINLTIGFSEDVIVDTTNGTPTLQLQTGDIDRYATYASGSGSSTLTFQYTVQEGDTSTDLDQLSSTALTLNGGSINDAAGNAAILTLAAPGDTGSLAANADLVIDTTRPTGSQGSFAAAPAFTQEGEDTPFGIPDDVGHASPAFADIDGDGDLDLFIGNVTGNILFFRNTAAPGATTPAYTQEEGANGEPNPFGIPDVGSYASPALADVDADGDLDLFIGYGRGETLFFRNTAAPGSTTPAYTQEEGNTPFGITDVRFNAKPTLGDIDGDGDLDLFIGDYDGNTLFFRNTAAPGSTTPAYTQEEGANGEPNPFGIPNVEWGTPEFADADNDGDLDLFIGNRVGNTLFFRNTGSASAPAYTREEGANGEPNPFGISDVGNNANPALADIDGDGDLDLFIGKNDGNTFFFRNTAATPVAPVNATTTNGIYGIGAVINLTIGFSEDVIVDTTNGTPTLQLQTGDIDRYATYASGSGSTLTFQYTVQEGDTSTDLDQLSSTALTLNGGSINDAAGNAAILTLAAPGDTGSLAANADLVIDTTRPTGSQGSFAGAPAFAKEEGANEEPNPFGIGDVGYSASPALADVDDDGDLDLFIGDYYGNTFFFRNTAAPGSTTPAYTQEEGANGEPNPFGISGVDGYASPAFADIDGDGDLDLFIGNDDGNTVFFRNTAAPGATTPAYTQEESANGEPNPFGIEDVGSMASPAFADIDGDGDLDLFIGKNDGNTFFFRNTAAPGSTTPAYTQEEGANGEPNPFGISGVDGYASPAFADIDGDGDLDLFIGNDDGNTVFFRNTGSASAPAYTREEGANGEPNPFGISDVGNNANPALADIDGDGDLDLFIGKNDGNTFFFRNTAATPVAPVNATTTNGIYGIGAVINLTIGFSEDVIVDTTNGTPTLQLQTGDIDRYATYASGSGSSTLTFQYTVQEGDTSTDLDQLSSTALTLNGGSINDAAGNAAILTLAAPAETGSLAANADLVIDTTRPTGSQASFVQEEGNTPFGIANVGNYASPAFADIDGDGDLDLFIGNYYGNTFFFRNTAAPGATTPAYTQEEGANGEPNPFGISGVDGYASPAFADIDGDGDLDLFIGNDDGNTVFFRNTAAPGATTPAYTQEEGANGEPNPFGIEDVGSMASPAFADIDGDGDLDLFIGKNDGNTFFFRNTAAPGSTTPAYTQEEGANGEPNPFGISGVDGYASPAFADIDGDGDLDLFIGNNDGNTLFFRNTATPGATTPAYTQEEGNTPFGIPDDVGHASPAFADIDGDGDLDLFIGDYDGNTLFFRNTAATPVAPVNATTTNGIYGIGAVINLTIGFSEDVIVDTTNGTPTLQLQTGDIDRYATYASGSGTATLTFQYTVQEGDTSTDLDQLSSTALTLNGGSINDAAGNAAILTLAAPGDTGSLAANADLVIDTTRPTGSQASFVLEEGANEEPNPFGIASVGEDASPALADIDGDGDLDLFIGDYDGNTLFFRNTAAPGATTPAYTQEEGNTPFGIANVGEDASPALADIDGDGDLDLFIGDYDGNTLFFRNTAAPGATTPAYTQEEGNTPFGIADVSYDASPAFADIDGDGDLDLFIGNIYGNTLFFRNTAAPGATTPAYTQEEGANGEPNPFEIPAVGGYASPAFADIDADGDLDLFIGNNDGNTLFFRNTAAPGATTPAYTQEEGDTPFGIPDDVGDASPAFADADGDGDLDLFIGDYDGNTLFFRNIAAPPVAPVSSTTTNGSYGVGAVINLTIGFSEHVIVDTTNGTPTLQLQTGDIDRYAVYSSGSGSSTLTFQYTVQEGDTSTDLDQLSSTALTLNGGSINDAAGNAAILTLAAPGDTGSLGADADLVIDTTRPTGSHGSFATAPEFAAAATNPFGITNVVSSAFPAFADADGDGDLDLFIGNTDREIEGFEASTFFFRNTAAPGATSPAFAAAATNPFGITELGSYSSPAFADADNDGDLDLFLVDGIGNTHFFRNTAAPGATSPSYAPAVSNPFGITNARLNARPAIADADNDGDFDFFISNGSGDTLFFRNTAAPGATSPAFATAATNPFGITNAGTYASPAFADADNDDDLDLFISNNDGNTLFFRNTAAPGSTTPAYTQEEGANGEPNPFGIPNVEWGTPEFADADNDGDLDLFMGIGSGDTLFFRNTAATPVAPVASTTADGSYGIGDVITLTVGFSEDVVVNTSGGTPTLQLQTGDIDRYATYASGSGSSTLTFQYTVQEGDTSTDLDQLSSTALTLNGGSINDAAGNAAILTLAAPGDTGSLAANADLVIDTTRPTGSQGSFAAAPAFAQEGEDTPFGIPDVGYYASPALIDVDSDGDLDLFIGIEAGNTLFFRNTATTGATTPAYTQEGEDTPFGIANVGSLASPAFADIDGDGDLDLFIGNNAGNTLFFRNTAAPGSTTPAYTQEGEDTPFGIANVGSYASPAFADIDADGDLDLFIRNMDGNLLFFRNTAAPGATTPAYTQEEGANGEPNPFGIPDVGEDANPAFADIDGDGDLDLFIGNNDGNTLFFRNTATPGATTPAYTQEEGNTPFGIAGVAYTASPALADVDDDGDLDLFIGGSGGNNNGNTLFFRNTGATPVAPVNATTANGSYGIGAVINLTIGFSEDVIVDTTNGTPTLQLQTGDIDRYAVYASGSGSSTLTFQYTVQEGDTSTDLDQLSSTALTLNGGSINDAAGNAAILTLAAPAETGSLAANADLVIDTATVINSATYNVSSGVLAVTGSNFVVNSGSTNDIDISKLTITGEGGNTYSLTSNDIELTSATAFSVTLNSADQLQLAGLLNKNGNTSGGGTTYNLAAASSWNPGASSSPADSTGNEITVSNVAAPNLSSASYDDSTGVLALTGSSLPAYPGSSNDIDVSKLTITGESGGTYTLSSSDVELTSATEFIVTLNSTDQTNLDSILNKNGTSSSLGTTYNIAAADRWAPGSDSSVNSADLTGNAVTVTNIPNRAPTGTVSISGTATQGETLTAANTLVDLDGIGIISYQWSRAGAEISGATSSTYLLGRADVGSTITVTANYTDGEEKAESVTSISATPMVASHIYHLSSDTINGIANSGILITNKRGQTFSDTSSYRWDAVKAVQDGSNQWKVLLRGDNSHDGKWYCWNVDETGVITSGSGWKNTADAINAGWDSIFGNSLSPNTDTSLSVLDVNANGIVDDITNYHLTNGSTSVWLHSTDLQSYSHESSANWDVSKAVEINGAWKVLVKGANSMDGMWSVWDAGVSGTVTQASTWMSTADSLKEGWEQIFGDVIQVDNIIGPVENRNDSNSDGLMDDMVIYHLDNGENGDGMAIHNSRGNTYSHASTSRWDAVLAVEDNNNDWKVLLQGTGSYDGKWYYWNVDDTGLITSGSGWKSYQGAIADNWESFFGNDLKGFNNNQLIIEDPNVITS